MIVREFLRFHNVVQIGTHQMSDQIDIRKFGERPRRREHIKQPDDLKEVNKKVKSKDSSILVRLTFKVENNLDGNSRASKLTNKTPFVFVRILRQICAI